MRKLTILVDLDDTLINFCEAWVEYINEKHGTAVCMDDIREWDILKAFPTLGRKEIYAPLFEEEMWKRVAPLPGAVKYLKKMIDDSHKVIIVTASHHDTLSFKFNNVLYKYFPFITQDDVIITSQKQLIRGDVLIDDAPHNLLGGEYTGVLVNAPHNRIYNAEQSGFVRGNDWCSIYKAVCDISRGVNNNRNYFI